ncbi:MAG: hypothetical protein P4L84_35285 [Isosphaeraceae bacterium]|nr:hypothetical protein [Isosphaeraceae bacterium]
MSTMRRWMPGVPDAVFGIVLATVLVGGRSGFLNDPGTFWHLRLGREILRTGDVPRFDTLTYTRELQPWVDQSWLFDVSLASLVDHFGWSAAVAATALLLATLYGALARGLVRDGTSPFIALVVAVVAVGIASVHFLVRPHLFTFMMVLWFLDACRRQHEEGGWHIAVLPPLMVLWANLHGGFLAGPIIVATALLGHVVSGPWDSGRRKNVTRFGAVLVLCVLAPLVNPYGVGLYQHVGKLLISSGVTELIDEYQPMPFGQAKARVFEWVVLALIALPTLGSRRLSRYDLAHSLVWLHFALGSIRHAPLFALAMAPGLAHLLDGLPLSLCSERGGGRWSLWPAVVGVALVVFSVSGAPLGGFSPTHWPLKAVPALNARPADARLFHEQDWGGLIEAETTPPRRAFVDDRFELFGKAAILEYVEALQGGPRWDALRDRERFDLVWVRPERGLARRLESDVNWRVAYRDDVSVLFERVVPATHAAAR